MPLHAADLEGMAFAFQRQAGVTHVFSPRPSLAAVAYGLELVDDVPPGEPAYYNREERAVHYRLWQNEEIAEDDIAHEADHAIMDDHGVPRDEQEQLAGDLSLFWRIQYKWIRKLVWKHGFNPQVLLDAFHQVASPSTILARCALACDVALILHNGVGERVVSSLREITLTMTERDERALVRRVQRSGQCELGQFGVVAWPYKHRRRTCVAIVLDMERCLMVG